MIVRDRQTLQQFTGSSKQFPFSQYLPEEWKENGVVTTRVFPSVDKKYVKIMNDEFVEMTAGEKSAVDQAEADAIAQAEADAKDITKATPMIKAVALALGKLHGKTPTEIKALIEAEM
jgi:hypothetical protein